jgi:hypothetical protein
VYLLWPFGNLNELHEAAMWLNSNPLRSPRFVLEYFLIGQNVLLALIQRLHQTLQLVPPEVLSS